MKNTSSTISTLCEIGIFAALGFVLDELQGIIFKGVFPNGGSIGFAMIAVLIIAYRRGLLPALLTGLIMGVFDIATSAYIIHPVQLFLDYILPYAFVGFVGLLKPMFDKYEDKKSRVLWLIAGCIIGGMLKFTCHYLAGVFFWANPTGFAWGLNDMSPYLYCFVYNIAFIGPSILLTGALMVAIYWKAPHFFVVKKETLVESSKSIVNPTKIILSVAVMAIGTGVFICYLIKYIGSFSSYQDSNAYGYDFNPDYMMLTVVGFFLLIMGINNLIKCLKDKFTYIAYSGALAAIILVSFIYGLSRLIRMYVKEKDPTFYWIWFIVNLVLLAGAIVFFIISLNQRKKSLKEPSNI